MLVDINKIVVGDRIRKDFGDIQELADNIKKNGLLNPITINNRHMLLAGERRLRACKLLGWAQVDVRMVESEDEAQDIEIELSENTVRRNFTGSELAEGIRRQMEIEGAKAKERMAEGGRGANISTPSGKSRDKAAEQFGISGEQARKTLYVADNADLLDPADFAEWDEGKLSTNKAYQRIKAAKEQAERERDDARADVATARKVGETLKQQRDEAREDIEQYQHDVRDLQEEIAALEKQADKAYEDGYKAASRNAQPQVVTREVESEASKKRISDLEHEVRVVNETHQRLRKQLEDTRQQLQQANDLLGESDRTSNARRDIEQLTIATNSYLRNYGGRAWAFDQFDRVDDTTQTEFIKAINNLAAFAQNLAQMIQDKKQLGVNND